MQGSWRLPKKTGDWSVELWPDPDNDPGPGCRWVGQLHAKAGREVWGSGSVPQIAPFREDTARCLTTRVRSTNSTRQTALLNSALLILRSLLLTFYSRNLVLITFCTQIVSTDKHMTVNNTHPCDKSTRLQCTSRKTIKEENFTTRLTWETWLTVKTAVIKELGFIKCDIIVIYRKALCWCQNINVQWWPT